MVEACAAIVYVDGCQHAAFVVLARSDLRISSSLFSPSDCLPTGKNICKAVMICHHNRNNNNPAFIKHSVSFNLL